MGLQGFERGLERLVEGTFNKAFRSGLQPVEIGRRVARVLDAGRTLGVSGRHVAPNNIGVYLSPADTERFQSFAEALARELAEAARQHARDEGYQFLGPVTVTRWKFRHEGLPYELCAEEWRLPDGRDVIEVSLKATEASREAVQEILRRGAETGIFFSDARTAGVAESFDLTEQDRDFLRSLSIRPDPR